MEVEEPNYVAATLIGVLLILVALVILFDSRWRANTIVYKKRREYDNHDDVWVQRDLLRRRKKQSERNREVHPGRISPHTAEVAEMRKIMYQNSPPPEEEKASIAVRDLRQEEDEEDEYAIDNSIHAPIGLQSTILKKVDSNSGLRKDKSETKSRGIVEKRKSRINREVKTRDVRSRRRWREEGEKKDFEKVPTQRYLALTGGVQLTPQSARDPAQTVLSAEIPLVRSTARGVEVFPDTTFQHILHELVQSADGQQGTNLLGWTLNALLQAIEYSDDTLLQATQVLLSAQRDTLLALQKNTSIILTELDVQSRARMQRIQLADAKDVELDNKLQNVGEILPFEESKTRSLNIGSGLSERQSHGSVARGISGRRSRELVIIGGGREGRDENERRNQNNLNANEFVPSSTATINTGQFDDSYLRASYEFSLATVTIMNLLQRFTRIILDALAATTQADLPIEEIESFIAAIARDVPGALRVIYNSGVDGVVLRGCNGNLDGGFRWGVGRGGEVDRDRAGIFTLWRRLVQGEEGIFNGATSNAIWTQLLAVEGLETSGAMLMDEQFHAPTPPELKSAVASIIHWRDVIRKQRQQYAPYISTTSADIWVVYRRREKEEEGDCSRSLSCVTTTRRSEGVIWLLNSPVEGKQNLFTYAEASIVASKAGEVASRHNLHERGWRLPSVDDVKSLLRHKRPNESDRDFLFRLGFASNLNQYLSQAGMQVRFWTSQNSMVEIERFPLLGPLEPIDPRQNRGGNIIYRPVDINTVASVFAVHDYCRR